MIEYPQTVTIAVAGGTGSGKTTVVNAILQSVDSNRIAHLPHDAYYHPTAQIPHTQHGRANFDHPDALDTCLMIEHIKQLQNGQSVEIPVYDFTKYQRTSEPRRINPQPIIFVEGILVLAEARLRELFDMKIFVDADADVRLIRRLKRDISERARTLESVIDQYEMTVRPMHLEFVEPSKRYADVIIPEGGYNTVAIEMLVDRIRGMLTRLK